jgi:hypothetical protein
MDCERFEHAPERDLAFRKGDIIMGTNTKGLWFEGYLEADASKTVKKFPSTFVTRQFADDGKRWLCVTLFECEGLTQMDGVTGNDVYANLQLDPVDKGKYAPQRTPETLNNAGESAEW